MGAKCWQCRRSSLVIFEEGKENRLFLVMGEMRERVNRWSHEER